MSTFIPFVYYFTDDSKVNTIVEIEIFYAISFAILILEYFCTTC